MGRTFQTECPKENELNNPPNPPTALTMAKYINDSQSALKKHFTTGQQRLQFQKVHG